MLNVLLKSIVFIFLLIQTALSAQDFQGSAVYQTKTKLEMDLASSGIPADRIQRIQEMMKNQLEKTYILTFDKTASIYKEEEKLDQSVGGGGGMRFSMMGGGASGKYYKNTQTKTSAKENEFSGKNFLIKDALKTYEWKMEQETKMIGENLCFKATTIIEMPANANSFSFGRRNNDNKEEVKEEEEKIELVPVIAWYSMDIPVSHGPGDYWGLPGLILEINAGNTQILCTKIVLNPKEKADLSEPSKGKVVTQKEYDEILKVKMKEMRERFSNERQKSGDGGMHIRVGG
ncbi:MAG: GLPGLI family protein [Bacteroidetes bacterium HGW-Bacteroidetes-3]|jgi:GLPGLI family protein|nr:MAG: GLPGLI family protein [Bacteroidetes bacterium HGW-Bacteroidetes-3]